MSAPLRCWAEVDLDALRQNLAWLRHEVGPDMRIVTVVKADAYGHGLKQTAALLMQGGTDVFGVANLTEARAIRATGRGWPVLMLGACLPDEVGIAVKDNVIATVSSRAEAETFSKAAGRLRRTATLQLKLDTGMTRLGAPVGEAVNLARAIRALPNVDLNGVWTHFSSADEDPHVTAAQRSAFERAIAGMAAVGIGFDFVHSGNSGALLWEPAGGCNAIRPGLLVYGVVPSGGRRGSARLRKQLRPAMTLKCRVSFLKTVRKGTPVSYGGSFVAPRRMKLATLSGGYGDGYPRQAGGKARVLIRGKLCPIVGRVTMDQTMVDVSRVPGIGIGDEAVLFGRQGDRFIGAGELAAWCDTIPWEILTRVSGRVPRIYLGGRAA